MATEPLSEIMREIESLRKVVRQLNAPITPSPNNLDKSAAEVLKFKMVISKFCYLFYILLQIPIHFQAEQAAGTVRKLKMPLTCAQQ